MNGIAIYIEGGGDHAAQKAELRRGFDELLRKQREATRARKLHWKLLLCGGRKATFDSFRDEIHSNPDALHILLVDAEAGLPVESGNHSRDAKARLEHLKKRDGWDMQGVVPERVHLMVQCMESWIVADPEALESFYGQGFAPAALPARQNLEEESKAEVSRKLAAATKKTRKGEYKKIEHASKLLQLIDTHKLSVRCPRFATLTRSLSTVIASL